MFLLSPQLYESAVLNCWSAPFSAGYSDSISILTKLHNENRFDTLIQQIKKRDM